MEKGWNRSAWSSNLNGGNSSSYMDGLDDSFDTLSDGMDGKLQKAATYFEFDPEEIAKDDYAYRPDVSFQPGTTYTIKVCKVVYYFHCVFGLFGIADLSFL